MLNSVNDNAPVATPSNIPEKALKQFVKRWNEILQRRAVVDHDLAVLAYEIRSEFPKGSSGDLQFRRWCAQQLAVSAQRTRMLSDAANAIACGFTNEDNWIALGGWPVIAFIMGLAPKNRIKVWAAGLRRAKEKQHPLSYWSIRDVAFQLGIYTTRPGRPTRTASETKVSILREYINKLIENGTIKRPPVAVRNILKPSKLDRAKQIAQQLLEKKAG